MLDERAGGARELTAALQLAVGNASKPLEGAESTTAHKSLNGGRGPAIRKTF